MIPFEHVIAESEGSFPVLMQNINILTPFYRYVRYFDLTSFFLTLLLTSISLLFIFSATYQPYNPYSIFFKKQMLGVILGYFFYFFFCFIDYRLLQRWGFLVYFIVLTLLLFTIVKGSIGMGARRWINIGIIKFQPSELTKIFFPPFFTQYLYTENDNFFFNVSSLLLILIIIAISTILIIKQPDLGTGILVLFSSLILLWIAGVQGKYFCYGLLLFFLGMPIFYNFLHPYQQKRIAVFLGYGNNQNERYQVEQSKIAIGSGKIFGKGLLKGTQNKFLFLPECRTDFIFSVICEEWGFLGACAVLILYIVLILRTLQIIYFIKISIAQFLALGLLIPFILSTIINIGMVTGLLPIVGIPLPLMSYGITHTWITLASFGWIQGIAIRQYYLGT